MYVAYVVGFAMFPRDCICYNNTSCYIIYPRTFSNISRMNINNSLKDIKLLIFYVMVEYVFPIIVAIRTGFARTLAIRTGFLKKAWQPCFFLLFSPWNTFEITE